MPEMQKLLGVTDFVSEIKRVENFPDSDKIGARKSAWSTKVYLSNRSQVSMAYKLINHAGCW